MVEKHTTHVWPLGGGETGAMIRAFDWAAHPLGSTDSWPQSLRTSIDLMLSARAQIVVMWGPELTVFYNDAYAPTIGKKHPAALGSPACGVWAELWDDLQPLLLRVIETGETVSASDRPFQIDRHGFLEEVFFDISYSPIRDEEGGVAGALCIVSETTERVLTSRKLLESQQTLQAEQAFTRLVLDSASEGVHAISRDGTTTFCNAGFLRILGYASADEVLGRKLHGEIHHSHADGSPYHVNDCPILRAASEGTSADVRGEYFFRRDGTRVPVDYRAEPIWRDGQLQGAVCTFVDTSARLENERALRRSEQETRQISERLELAIDSGVVLGSWVWDIPEDRFTADKRFAQTFGIDPQALRDGMPIAEVKQSIHADDIAGVEDLVSAAMQHGGAYSAEYRVQRADGSWHWIEANGRVECDAEGRPVRFPGVLLDIAARKRIEASQQRESAARKESEARLREIDQQFRMAQDACGIGVFHVDLASNILTGSQEFFRLFGIPFRAALPTGEFERLAIDEDRHVPSTNETRRNASAALDVEYRVRRPDTGEIRWIARRAQFIRDERGTPVAMWGVVRDVTEHKSAEAALRESEARFRTLAQALPTQVWTATADGKLDWINDRISTYSGLPTALLLEAGWGQIVHPEDLPLARARWRECVASRELFEVEERLMNAEGRYHWHIVRALPFEDADKQVHWVGTNTDIDDQKRTQKVLAELNTSLEQRVNERTQDLNRMWRLSTDIMLVCRFDGTLTAVNPAWTTLLGWEEHELIGQSFMQFVHPDDVEITQAEMERIAQGQITVHFENRYLHKDGSARTISWRAVPDEKLVHAVGRDITAEQAAAETLAQTEAQLRQSHKMEAIGQLTGGIAHDFNNLLQGITGSIEVVKRLLAAGRTDNVGRFMDSATNSAHKAASLIHRLLAFSRQQTLDNRPVDVNQLVLSMSELLQRTLGEHIDLQVQLTPDMWPAFSDANQLESAVLNLAINARDAMPDGGRLTIRTSSMTLDRLYAGQLDGLMPGDYAQIAVTDTGVGMSPETVAKAFDPFFTTKPLGQGTGLGLSMIYGFAKQSGGHVRIESELGAGTTIRLYLPRADRLPGVETEVPARELPQGSGETVLLVEDDPTVRLLVLEVLRELGYRALEATNGLEAIPILQSARKIDLLISDVGLPGLNGRQVAEIARQHRPGLQVLFITGYAEHMAARSEPLESGIRMISKPFAIDELARKIRESFHESRQQVISQ